MLGSQFQSNSRWTHQCKPGQAVACKIVERINGGYSIEFGPERVKGFLPTQRPVAPGSQLLLQFLGYKNNVPVFNASYGLNAFATVG